MLQALRARAMPAFLARAIGQGKDGAARAGRGVTIGAAPGEHVFDAFDPDHDSVLIDMTDLGAPVAFETRQDAGGARVDFRLATGNLTLLFPSLQAVPARAVVLRLREAASGDTALMSLASLPGDDIAAVPPNGGDPDGGTAAAWLADAMNGPERIDGFRPGEDILHITLEARLVQGAAPRVAVIPDPDGAGAQVSLDGQVVALLPGAAEATLADVHLDRVPDAVAQAA